MCNTIQEISYLLGSKTQCIWVKTYEEERFIKDLVRKMIESKRGYKINSWSMSEGLKSFNLSANQYSPEIDKTMIGPEKILKHISQVQNDDSLPNNIFILKDFHLVNEAKVVIRFIRDIKETNSANYCPIIVLSPVLNIPVEHEKLFKVLNYDTPNAETNKDIITAFSNSLERDKAIDKKKIDKISKLSVGLTQNELVQELKTSMIKYGTISEEMFLAIRENLINKTGLLTLSKSSLNMNDMGGNNKFKEWVEDVKISLSPEAEDFGVERTKGFLSIGIPGTSKTLSAEMLSNELDLPLLKFDISKVMNSLVGKSEQNMSKALDVVKACSPCILLIDEIEKSLSGVQSSGKTDGGTMSRIMGALLQFLSSEESKDVLTIMTSNDISQMPPELTRSGRLDTVWYFGLPEEEERGEIFKIHFGKSKLQVSDNIINYAVSVSNNFTGAEIKEAVKNSVREAFKRKLKGEEVNSITEDDIDKAVEEVIPLYDSYKEKIAMLENYAKHRARRSHVATNKAVSKKRVITLSK